MHQPVGNTTSVFLFIHSLKCQGLATCSVLLQIVNRTIWICLGINNNLSSLIVLLRRLLNGIVVLKYIGNQSIVRLYYCYLPTAFLGLCITMFFLVVANSAILDRVNIVPIHINPFLCKVLLLPFRNAADYSTVNFVAPHAGAWIETERDVRKFVAFCRSPRGSVD